MRLFLCYARISVLALIVFAMTFGMRSCFASDLAPLKIYCIKNYPPMTYVENGQPKGVVIDILHALERRIDRKILIELIDWQHAQELVKNGEADGLCPFGITEERKTEFDFSAPIITLNLTVFTRINKRSISTLGELNDLRVGVTAGGITQQIIQANPKINVVVVTDHVAGLQLVENGQLDAIILDQWVGSYLLAEHNISDVQPGKDSVAQVLSAIAFKKGNATLVSQINKGLAALRADGTLDRIYNDWHPKEIIFETREHAERKIYYFLLTLLIFLLCGTTAWIVTMKREVAERVKSETELKENRERLVKLSAHIEQIKEEQRIRIAREIHDDLGGNLVATKMVLHTMKSRTHIDAAWLAEKINYIETLIDRTMDAGHRIVLELRPGVLDLGIIAALEWQAKEFEKQNNIPCTFTSNSASISFSSNHAAAIFRIVQEALTNIAKHASATHVHITIVASKDNVTFMIGDNGKGLEPGHEKKSNSFGLLGMAERGKEIGGTVWIESKPGAGCVVTLKIPI